MVTNYINLKFNRFRQFLFGTTNKPGGNMGTKIYVGNISWSTTDQQLAEDFSSFGTITEAKVVMDRETNRSKGFGFVTFESDEAAEKAITTMDGQSVGGRNIRVSVAQDRPRQPRGTRDGDGYSNNRGSQYSNRRY